MTGSTQQGGRVAGVTVPLFSLRGERDWGIGDIAALAAFGRWVAPAGLRLIQILPLGEMAAGETSPYSALTAFGIDPLYIAMGDIPELPEARWAEVLGADGMTTLARVQAAPRVDYNAVRALKVMALRAAFATYMATEHGKGGPRDQGFQGFLQAQAEWLADYAMFRALKDAHGGRAWWDWAPGLRDRAPESMAAAWRDHADAVRFHAWLQWLAHTQWAQTRTVLKSVGVEIMGDLPFMVGRDSADVWSHRGEFREDALVGAPPDQFNDEGQDWGLPPYGWDAMAGNGYAWLRRRARYNGTLYDRFRIDHLVGFFRTYMRPAGRLRGPDGRLVAGFFHPSEEHAQAAHGQQVLTAMSEGAHASGAGIIAEDLGVIPDFVRPVLRDLGIPGYKVLIWEKDYHAPGHPFLDPRSYPALSVACFGTHDTDPVAVWWEALGDTERADALRIPALAARAHDGALGRAFTPAVHGALLEAISGAGSDLVLLLIQDVLGTRDRINVPATVGDHNWTWRLPGTVTTMAQDPAVTHALARVHHAVVSGRRG